MDKKIHDYSHYSEQIEILNRYFYRNVPERNAYLYIKKFFKTVKNFNEENIKLFCYLKNNVRASKIEHLEYVQCIYQITKEYRYEPKLTKKEIVDFINKELKVFLSWRQNYKYFNGLITVNDLYSYNDFYIIVLRALRIRDRRPYTKKVINQGVYHE